MEMLERAEAIGKQKPRVLAERAHAKGERRSASVAQRERLVA